MKKIIDFDVRGNVIRLFLGELDCYDYWGDDWDDAPYEHNAGEVYDKYITGIADIYVDVGLSVYTPESDWSYQGNSPFTKESFKERKAPCVIICKSEWFSEDHYSVQLGNENALRIYFEDRIEPGKYFIDESSLLVSKQLKEFQFEKLKK